VDQSSTGQVGAAASRDDRTYFIGAYGRRRQGGGGAGAGTEVADRKVLGIGELREPVGCVDELSASSRMSKRSCAVRASMTSSCSVSKSINRVASFASLSKRAT
jgi:hypothetical protein